MVLSPLRLGLPALRMRGISAQRGRFGGFFKGVLLSCLLPPCLKPPKDLGVQLRASTRAVGQLWYCS